MLDPAGESDNPVLDWVSGTGLRPMLEVLEDEGIQVGKHDALSPSLDAKVGHGDTITLDHQHHRITNDYGYRLTDIPIKNS